MSGLDLAATGQAPAVAVDDVRPAESERFRLARLAREEALRVPGVVSTDVGPLGLVATVGGGRKLEGVVCSATKSGAYDVSLRLTCSIVPLLPLGERVRAAVERAAVAARAPLAQVSVHVADIAGVA